MSLFGAVPIFLLLIVALIIPFVVGAYVYRDAKRRGMNTLLWAFVAAIGPALIGLIAYLLVRVNYSDLRCPICNTPVTDQYIVCPTCGAKLRPSCPNCAMAVELDWKVCPKCTQPLSDHLVEPLSDVQAPTKAKDNSIGKILAMVLIIPILLISILVLSLSASFASGSSSIGEVSVDQYFEEMNREGYASEAVIASKVQEWLNSIDSETVQAHALRYDYSSDSGNEYFFLVYVPKAGMLMDSGMKQSGSIFGTTLTLELQRVGHSGSLYNIVSSADELPNLKILLDGKKLPCNITTVDYNPTLFYIVPQYDKMDPNDDSIWMPERITVVKLINNHNEGAVVIEDKEIALDILASIDGSPYLDWEHDMYRKHDGSGGYDFKDGFDIIIEYKTHNDLVLHQDMIHCLVLPQYDGYYLIDDHPVDGRFIREIDDQLYNTLSTLFE